MTEGAPGAARSEGAAGRPEGGPAGAPNPAIGAAHPAVEISPRARFEVLGAILLALLLGALDQTIVGTALPRIVTDLRGNDFYTWAVTIYLLTSTISVPFYGKLSDYYGRKPLLIFGISVFLVGSALSGLSGEMWQLILFRGIQGIGAGSLFPISLAVIGDLFTPAERGKYQGLFGAVFGLSALIGPALGGIITDNVGWHWIFYINLPLGLISLLVVSRVLPSLKRPKSPLNLDVVGAIVFVAAMIPLLVGLTNKRAADWATPEVGGLLLIAAVLIPVFLFIESRVQQPIVPLDLWRDRTYAGSLMATFFAAFGFFAATIFLPRFYQVVKGESATTSGYELFPLLLGVIVSSIVSGQIVARTGKYKVLLLASLVLVGVGSLLFTNLVATSDAWVIRAWQFVLGVGIGPTLAVFTIVIQNAVPFSKLGVATSNLTFFRQIGGTVGLSLAGSLFGSQVADQIPARLLANGIPQQFVDLFKSAGFDQNNLVGVGNTLGQQILAGVPAQFRQVAEPFIPKIVTSIYEAISLAIGSVFWLGLAASVLAFLAVLVIRELPLRSSLGPARGDVHGARGPGRPGAEGVAHQPGLVGKRAPNG
jgi:EmrB/QacA subfamily drug resistance transporter